MEVFDRGVFTPNDQFYVRWHWALIPNSVDVNTFGLSVRGHVNQELKSAFFARSTRTRSYVWPSSSSTI